MMVQAFVIGLVVAGAQPDDPAYLQHQASGAG
jgi:hypothetical protein